jgi:hypothetical protein
MIETDPQRPNGTPGRLPRRHVLRGVGAAVGLPWLESLLPRAAAAAAARPPVRLGFVYVPNGVDMARWRPADVGPLDDLPPTLERLEAVKSHLLVLSGLTADKARSHGDGPGDHARAMAAFLTGAHPRKTDGANILAGVSADQIAAERLAEFTRLPSLEIGCEAGGLTGVCDSGYACVYSATLSWKSPTQPLPKETDPRLVFERLFGGDQHTSRMERRASRRSVLDFISDDARRLAVRIGNADRRKLDEYFTAVREAEARLERMERLPAPAVPTGLVPPAAPPDLETRIRLLSDLLVLAFQTDSTRVFTFSLANEGSNMRYENLAINDGHHELSHHGGDPQKIAKIGAINGFHAARFAYLLERLQAVREGEGTLLDHCVVAYGSGNSDGDRHTHDDLPLLLAGRGGGTIRGGRHVRFADETPVTNLWLAMLQRAGVAVDEIGDSTGPLEGLA